MKITRRQLRLIIENELKTEAVVGTIASAILSMPAILNKIAKIMEFVGKKIKREKLELRGEKLEHFAHKLHESYRKPIKKTIQISTKKELTDDQLEKYTDIFFGILIAGMIIYTGGQIKTELKHLSGKHLELTSLGLMLLETVLGSIEVQEEIDIISHLMNKQTQDKLGYAINDHVEKEGIHH